MKKVFIKCNSYNLEAEITIDGKKLAQNSKIGERIVPGARLQEWIEDLPRILADEYNDKDFDITFRGTLLDFEDLTEVFTQAYERGELAAKLDRISAKKTSDKEALIDDVFKATREGPFGELRDVEILSVFKHARSRDFEVCVVATMSTGRSTLINSVLGTKLMPSKQEACTAIITRIKDTEGASFWQAEVYNKDNMLVETHENLTYETMDRLNGNETVSAIKAAGDIPFVSAEDVSLVLVDTPGPNSSRDPEYKRVQSGFLNKSFESLVLCIMEGTFGSDDDNALLQRVADNMKIGGKQSKDRFIFVINRMDDRRGGDGDMEQTLECIRAYLRNHGISNPNLFPAAALPALNIRLQQNGIEMDEDMTDETEVRVQKLNRNASLCFETYASLPASICGTINKQLAQAAEKSDAEAEAFIHTDVVSIEAATRQYVQKYAKTAKVKNTADIFMYKPDEIGCFEETKQELARNRKDGERAAKQVEAIHKKVDDAKSEQKFEDAVDDAVVRVNDSARDAIETIIQKCQAKIRKRVDNLHGEELDIDEVSDEVERFGRFAKKLEPDFQFELDELIRENLLKTSNALLAEYKKKLTSLTEEIDPSTLTGISIDPLKLMGGSVVSADDFSVKKPVQSKKVEDGEEYIENTEKKRYKPWTRLQEKGYHRAKYRTVKCVAVDALAQEFLIPISEVAFDNGELARKHVLKQSNHIVSAFNKEFQRLDVILKKKLSELGSYATDQEKTAERVRETERRLAWLEEIKARVASILEI